MSAFALASFLVLQSVLAAPDTQRPLHDINAEKANESPKWSALPIRPARWTDNGHTINITIGNPPQQIPVYLDISSPDSWIVPTTLDDKNKPCHRSPSFNTSLSETYLPAPKNVDFTSNWIWGRGTMAFDTVGYGSLVGPFQPLIVADTLDGGAGGWNGCPMAGFVGLAPAGGRETSVLGKPSHFERMVDLGLLERDLFALRLAEPAAELSFGRVNPALFSGDFIQVPLVRGAGAWRTTASHLVVDDDEEDGGRPGLRFELDDEEAMFTTAYPGIHVPAGVFQGLMTALDFHNNWLVPPSVPCEKRDAMSNVTLNLGGQDLMLTPYDYTQFWDDFSDMPQCYSMFTTSEPGHRDSNKVILGWAFLRAFYSVFDQGEGVVRFASLS